MKKQLAIVALVAAVTGTGLVSARTVFAQTAPATPDQMSSLVRKLADRFGLNTADVQAVFDQERSERQAQMEARYTEQLNQLETEGKITDAQKQLILAKHREMVSQKQSLMQSLQGKSKEEIRTAMQTQRTELEQWAKQNNIDVRYLMGGMKHMGKGGGMGIFHGDLPVNPANTAR